MNGMTGIGRLASSAMLFGAMFTIMLLPAYGQQDVSPDWYDPAPNAAVVHPVQTAAVAHASQPAAATHQNQLTAESVSPAGKVAKARVKDVKLDQSGHNAAHRSGRVPSVGLVSCAGSTALRRDQHTCPAENDLAYQPVASLEGSAGLASVEQR